MSCVHVYLLRAKSCSFTPSICKLPRGYSNSATLNDNILTNKSDVDITRSNILSDICDFSSLFSFSHSFLQKPSSRSQLRINFCNLPMNVFNSKSIFSEAFFSQTNPSDQRDVDVVFSHCCYMLITLAPLRTSQIVHFRSVLATINKWH